MLSKKAQASAAASTTASDVPYAPRRGAKPASGLDGTCDVPSVSHGKPVKSQPRSHSNATNAAHIIASRGPSRPPQRSATHPAAAGKSARKAQTRQGAAAATGGGIAPKSFRLTYI